jgi:hypothetical protein
MTFGPPDRRSRQPASVADGSTRESIAEECREAALSFMSGVAAGWDKLDLVLWLTGPYARATRHGKHGERVAALGDGDEIPDETLEALVTRVRGQLIASLETAALELGAIEFADECVERGYVRKVVDAEGRDAWIPVDGSRMRLRDRLRALFAADYLNAPYTYAELLVCHRCEAVVFDARAKRIGICGAHRMSGMVPREPDADADYDEDDVSVPPHRHVRSV